VSHETRTFKHVKSLRQIALKDLRQIILKATHKSPIPEEFYLAGRHVLNDASVEGLIAFFFACYGGGTPKLDDFAHLVEGPQATIAPKAFVVSLPKRLLAHPAGGALAVIGHVERAWTYSFMWEGAGEQSGVFENALTALANGKRIGSVMEYFNSRYSQLSSDLIIELENRKYYLPGRPESETRAEDETLAGIWTSNNDARSYVVLAGHQQEIQAERDRKLDAVKEQRKNRRQGAA
jgi:hypothetical protein